MERSEEQLNGISFNGSNLGVFCCDNFDLKKKKDKEKMRNITTQHKQNKPLHKILKEKSRKESGSLSNRITISKMPESEGLGMKDLPSIHEVLNNSGHFPKKTIVDNKNPKCVDNLKEQNDLSQQNNINFKSLLTSPNIQELINLIKFDNNNNIIHRSFSNSNNSNNQLEEIDFDMEYLYNIINTNYNESDNFINLFEKLNDSKEDKNINDQLSNKINNKVLSRSLGNNDTKNIQNENQKLKSTCKNKINISYQNLNNNYRKDSQNNNSNKSSSIFSFNNNSDSFNSSIFFNNQNDGSNNSNFFSNDEGKKELNGSKLKSPNNNKIQSNSNILEILKNVNNYEVQYNSSANAEIDNNNNNDKDIQFDKFKKPDSKTNPQFINSNDLGNLYLNSVLFDTLYTILREGNTNDKLLLFNLLSNSHNEENSFLSSTNIFELITSLKIDNLFDSMSNYFKREIIQYTIENFCQYLSDKGYMIIPTGSKIDKLNKVIDTSEIEFENDEKKLDHQFENFSKNFDKYFSNEEKSPCLHINKKHNVKNMCSTCNQQKGKYKKAWLCPHIEKVHYARGKCRNCYLNMYHKDQKKKLSSIEKNVRKHNTSNSISSNLQSKHVNSEIISKRKATSSKRNRSEES